MFFPPDDDKTNDVISWKKLLKQEGTWAVVKKILGFEFDGNPGAYTIWLTEEKREKLVLTLTEWIRGSKDATAGIKFDDFHKTVAKLRHAFTSIPAGHGLLSPCNTLLGKKPSRVYLHRNRPLTMALRDARRAVP